MHTSTKGVGCTSTTMIFNTNELKCWKPLIKNPEKEKN